MRFQQRPVDAFQVQQESIKIGMPGHGIVARRGEWVVMDPCGGAQIYKHDHFIKLFEPVDDEAKELWEQLASCFLGQQR